VKNPDSSTEAATKDDDPSSTSATVQAGLEPGEIEPENLLDLLHALTSDNNVVFNMSSTTKSAKSVTFSDSVDYATVVPYSVVYGWPPHTKVATSDGWKMVSQHACHWTGKLSDVIKMRLKQRAYDKRAVDTFRQTMLRTCNARMYNDEPLMTPQMVATSIATHESCVTGFAPQLIAHPSLCLSMVKPLSQSTPSRS
jgi:hypothetical protein